MQIIITDARFRSRTIQLSGPSLLSMVLAAALSLLLVSVGLYHAVFLKGLQAGWPVFSALRQMAGQDEEQRRERFMRENIDIMAKRLGEMNARMQQLESLGERVSSLAGMNVKVDPAAIRPSPGQGGLLVPEQSRTMQELQVAMADLEQRSDQRQDLLTAMEFRLFEQKIKKLMLPTEQPVKDVAPGSGFGWRIDPFTGQSALHTGLDFPAGAGTPIHAAAGGVVVVQENHPQYGNMLEVEHGNGLTTRYAHAGRVVVKKGDLVRRGQKIAEVGNTGRSTGPHLHFEVLVQGVPQDPRNFLNAASTVAAVVKR
ncbi:MAG: M23 family metallopeptidase [Rhodoferax sp.]|nr:M23 family metallopeptidase [Rhodoferax sp.]